ncbi:MAG: sigma-70 family RNA polymerase sigma factor [Chloroflexota bacterium]
MGFQTMGTLNLPFMVEKYSKADALEETPDYGSMSELMLLRAAEKLDESALIEIHNRFYTPVFRFIASKVDSKELAEDFASDVFVRFIHAIRQKSAPTNSLKGWLYRVASNIVNDHYRKKYRRSYSGLTESEPSNDSAPEDIIDEAIKNKELKSAIGKLKEDQQNVISLRFAFEMSVAEVAEVMGKSETAIRQIQFRGIRKLAELMGIERK